MTDIISPVHPIGPIGPIGPIFHVPTGTQTQLAPNDLGGAIGCDVRGAFDELLFVEYRGTLSRMNLSPSPSYAVLGTGYTTPEDVKASADGVHAYITERTGDLVKVDLSAADRASATVIATGMTAPQQLFLDEANQAAYCVEYTSSGRLWRIDLTSQTMTAVLSGLSNAVGVVLSADRQTAYISEQMTGGATGRVSAFALGNGVRTTIADGFTAPFFLTWLDAGETTLLMPERDPVDRLQAIDVVTHSSVIVAQGLPTQPSSVAVVSPGTVLVCCNDVIDEIVLTPVANQVGGDLLEGIGWVPFNCIIQGLADTSSIADYFYSSVADNAPFGGSLPVMVNFGEAMAIGAGFYQVSVDGQIRYDVWHGATYDSTTDTYVSAVNAPQTVHGTPGLYPVLTAAEAEDWTALPGCYLDSTTLTTGMHTITVEFYELDGTTKITGASLPQIMVDNTPCTATQTAAAIGDGSAWTQATPCGFLAYSGTPAGNGQDVQIGFQASQPEGFGSYSISLYRGMTSLGGIPTDAGSLAGAMSTAPQDVELSVTNLMTFDAGTCRTAAFAVYLYVSATAQSGWGRCSQYDAGAAQAFMLHH
jgi:hypothetical protein